jgi:hypothetical protein
MSSGQQHSDNTKKPGERGIKKLNQSARRRITHFTASVVAVVGSDQEHKGELDLREKKNFSRGYNSTPISSRPELSSIFRCPTAFVRNREQASSSGMRRSKLAEPTSASARQAEGRLATTPTPRSRDEEDFGRERGSAHVSMHTSPSVVRRGGGGGSRRAFADESRTNCAVPLRRKSELFVFRTNCTVRRRLGNLSVFFFRFFSPDEICHLLFKNIGKFRK